MNRIIVFSLAALLTLTLSACDDGGVDDRGVDDGGVDTANSKTLVFCSEASPQGFDPAPYTDLATFDASSAPLYNGLLEFERGTTNLIPGLAESWSISGNGKEITFNLRREVKFHSTDYFTPTRDFNADDVIFSFMRQWEEEHTWYEYNSGISWKAFNNAQLNFLLVDIRRDDDYTVTFELDIPYAPILAILAENFASILSEEYATELEVSNSPLNLNTHPIGTGPFQFVAYEPDTEIRYKAHPKYWNGVQAIGDLVFAITPDDSERYEKLIAGKCHVAPYINPANMESLRQEPGIIVLEQVGLNVSYLAYNTGTRPFNSANVRKALNMAINKQAIVDEVFQGGAIPAKNPLPPTAQSYNQSTQDDVYDPEGARALLEGEGVLNWRIKIFVPPGQLWTPSAYRSYSPHARRIAKLIRADFAAVGVKVRLVSYNWDKHRERRNNLRRGDAVLEGLWSYTGDTQDFFWSLRCSDEGESNPAQWCNAKFDDLTFRALTTNDKAERKQLYEEAQLIFKREAPWATIAHEILFVPMSDKVIGYKVDPRGYHSFDGVGLRE